MGAVFEIELNDINNSDHEEDMEEDNQYQNVSDVWINVFYIKNVIIFRAKSLLHRLVHLTCKYF
jgi:hypothetical protein